MNAFQSICRVWSGMEEEGTSKGNTKAYMLKAYLGKTWCSLHEVQERIILYPDQKELEGQS